MPFVPKGWELIIILIVVLLIFGPKNLPKLGSAIGRTVKGLREGMDGKKEEPNAGSADVDSTVAAATTVEEDTSTGADQAADDDDVQTKKTVE